MMFRRLDVRLIVMVTAVILMAVGFTLYLVWWIDANTVTTVTTNGNDVNVTEEILPVSQFISDGWPLLLAAIGTAALVIIGPLIVRAVRPVRQLARDAHSLATAEKGLPESKVPKDDIQSLTQSFQSIAAKLARTDQLRRNMVNDVAHELRSPLTNIQCQLEAIQDGLVEPDGEMINSLYEEIMLLKRLTDDLQELALAEAGQLRLVFEPVSVKEVIHSAVHSMKPQSSAVNVEIKVDITADLPLVELDAERIQQVLRNLLDNALRHTPPGGEIVIFAQMASEEAVQIRVQDSGEGLPPDALTDVFERFYRVDPSRSQQTGGAGLGLAIARQIVRAHDGRIWAENRPQGGAVFAISLPITQVKIGGDV